MSEPRDLTCQQLVELVNEYLGHTLTAEDRRAFAAHLESCPPCTTYLEQMRTVVAVTGTLGQALLPEAVERELLDVFRRWHGRRGSR